jgi:thiamine-phosphate pyrophosphorylase
LLGRGIYLVTDRELSGNRELEAVEDACRAGIRIIQYREKRLGAEEQVKTATLMRRITREYGAAFIVNDSIPLAIECEADGVHLGQGDGEPEAAFAHGLVVGRSAATPEEAKKLKADYIGYGPVFGTKTKADAAKPAGIEGLARLREEVSIPVYAIGGINSRNLGSVMRTNVHGAAVVSAVMAADDFYRASLELVGEMAKWI